MPDRPTIHVLVPRRDVPAIAREAMRDLFLLDRMTTAFFTGLGDFPPASIITIAPTEAQLRASFARSFDWYMRTRGPRHYG